MAKVTMDMKTLVFPMPAFLIGANVDGKPNFMTAAWSGIAAGNPPAITVGIQPHRYTLKGIRQYLTFSVNVPSVDQAKETDYCGIISGTETDKVADCKFDIFFGKSETAPMIEQCPVNLECKVMHILDLGSHSLVVGRIEDSYITEDCLTAGNPDADKINPIIFVSPSRHYQAFGEVVAPAFNRELINKFKESE
ncbi:flavin reductase family protein [Chloroflexota bacterium]